MSDISFTLFEENLSTEYERIFLSIFPTDHYSTRPDKISTTERYLIRCDDVFIGISGIYILKEMPNVSWLDYFGVLPEFRKNRFGGHILSKMIAASEKLSKNAMYIWSTEDELDGTGLDQFYCKRGFEKRSFYTIKYNGSPVSVFARKLNELNHRDVLDVSIDEWLH